MPTELINGILSEAKDLAHPGTPDPPIPDRTSILIADDNADSGSCSGSSFRSSTR